MLLLHWKQAVIVRTDIQLADWTTTKGKHSYLLTDYLDGGWTAPQTHSWSTLSSLHMSGSKLLGCACAFSAYQLAWSQRPVPHLQHIVYITFLFVPFQLFSSHLHLNEQPCHPTNWELASLLKIGRDVAPVTPFVHILKTKLDLNIVKQTEDNSQWL